MTKKTKNRIHLNRSNFGAARAMGRHNTIAGRSEKLTNVPNPAAAPAKGAQKMLDRSTPFATQNHIEQLISG